MLREHELERKTTRLVAKASLAGERAVNKQVVKEVGHRIGLVLAGLPLLNLAVIVYFDGIKAINFESIALTAISMVFIYAAPRLLAWIISPFFRD